MQRHRDERLTGRKQNRFLDGRETLRKGGGRKRRDKTGETASSSSQGPCSSPLSPAGQGGGQGPGSPPGHPVQGAAWGKLGGRIVISVGVLLNYTTSYLSPGGAAGGQTDRWTDTWGPGGPGRAGAAPAAMVSPRHGPTDTSLCAAKAPQGRFYGWVPGPRNPGPRPLPPQEPRNQPFGPSLTRDPGVQAPGPFLTKGPWSPGPEPPPPSDLGVQPSLRPWERPSLPGFLGSGAWPPLSHWLPCLPVRFRKPGAVQTQQRSRYCRPFLPFSRTASIHHGIAVIHEHQQHPRPPTSPTQGSEELTTPPFCR